MPTTPNVGLNVPPIGSNAWGNPLNYNFSQLDLFLSGGLPLPALKVTGNVTIGGSITAGQFIGLDGGAFLTSALFDKPNGIPQLDANGKVPSALLPMAGGIEVVAFNANPVFDATLGSCFKLVLTGNTASSTFINGQQGASLVTFRLSQDGTGGRVFTWPSNVRNAGAVNPGPNARSTQTFAVDTDGSLDAIGPIMYS